MSIGLTIFMKAWNVNVLLVSCFSFLFCAKIFERDQTCLYVMKDMHFSTLRFVKERGDLEKEYARGLRKLVAR